MSRSAARTTGRVTDGGIRARRPGFAGRLMVAQTLVMVAGALTIWLVATAVGPGIFHDHLQQAGDDHTGAESEHIEEAFTSALLVSLGLALVTAVFAALVVSWYLSRRVERSIAPVTAAASRIAAGEYAARVPDPGLGGEFATLTETFNALADRLEHVETTRRRMLADLAHELRTPLATIDAHLEAVEDGVRDLDGATLAVVRGSTQRLRRLAEDIGAVSRAEEGDLEISRRSVAAAEIARAAVEAARPRYLEKRVQLDAVVDSAARVYVDTDRIGQVLGNLLDNALRHTPARGHVTLRCTDTTDWVELTVSDDGEGIAAEHLTHVFDRFYRADSARDRGRGGSGIGLSIVRALVEAHGGRVHADSLGPGRGAAFTVRLRVDSGR